MEFVTWRAAGLPAGIILFNPSPPPPVLVIEYVTWRAAGLPTGIICLTLAPPSCIGDGIRHVARGGPFQLGDAERCASGIRPKHRTGSRARYKRYAIMVCFCIYICIYVTIFGVFIAR